MDKNEYIETRNVMLGEAQEMINAGDLEGYKAKETEIKELDTKFEAIAKARADAAALGKNSVITPLEGKSATPKGEKTLETDRGKEEKENDAYRTAFAKNLMGMQMNAHEAEVFNAVNDSFRLKNATQTISTNTVLIPETLRASIWKEIGEAHPIINDVGMTFVPGDLKIIKEDIVGDDAEWYDEDTETEDSDVGFGEIVLSGCELSKNITVSWKMKQMSIDAFLAYITSKISEKMGNALAKAVINGLGKPGNADTFKPQPLGIATVLEAEENTPQIIAYTASVNYSTMTQLMAKIKSGYMAGAALYAKNDTIWNVLANIVDGMGRPMFVSDLSGGGVGRLLGLVIKEEDGVEDNAVLLANVAKGYVMNANENISMYQQDHVKARTTDYLGYAIVDGNVMTTKAFAMLRKIINTITPETASFSKAAAADIAFTIATGTGVTLSSVKNGTTTIAASNYTYAAGVLTIKSAYLAGLTNGAQTINITLSEGTALSVTITVAA